jgi:predicted ABC-type ATPase
MESKPKLLVIAGPNGSGKTSVTDKLLRHEWVAGCAYINPDNIARDRFGDWNSAENVMKAAQYATQLREDCIANSQSLIFETVLSTAEKVSYIERAKKNGYFVRLFFIGTCHPSVNVARIASRVMEGGHDVPISKIISRYTKSIANCVKSASIVDRLYVFDNSVDNSFPKLLFRAGSGKLIKNYMEINDWAKDIFQALKH